MSESIDDLTLTVEEDGRFAIGGPCPAAGTWSIDDGAVTAGVSSIPDIGGCPDTFTLRRESISSMVLMDDGTLRLIDAEGAEEIFTRSD